MEDKPCRCSRPCNSTVHAGIIMPPCHHDEQSSCNSYEEYCASESSTSNSTPFVSAPSSPKKNCSTPLAHYVLSTRAVLAVDPASFNDLHTISHAQAELESTSPASSPRYSEFEFSSRFSQSDTWFNSASSKKVLAPHMSTADDLFHNGKIRPLNATLCPSSYCLHCCSHSNLCWFSGCHTDPQFSDPCDPHPFSVHAEDHQQQPIQRPSMSVMGLRKPTSASSALEQWKKSMGKYDILHSRHADGQYHGEVALQTASLPLACYRGSGGGWHQRNGGGRHRRARSLSPLRVSHMDDMLMQARASSERGNTQSNAQVSDHAADLCRHMIRPRRTCRKSWTLKELLNMGDRKVHGRRRPQLLQGDFGNTPFADNQVQASHCTVKEAERTGRSKDMDASFQSSTDCLCNMEKTALEEERLYCGKKWTPDHEGTGFPWKLQGGIMDQEDAKGSGSAKFDVRPEVEADMRRRILLPYKKGLLGCLGFTCKLSSVKGLHVVD